MGNSTVSFRRSNDAFSDGCLSLSPHQCKGRVLKNATLKLLGNSKVDTSDKIRNILKEYEIGKVIGVGAFGQVRECTHRKTGKAFAVKVLNRFAKFGKGPWSPASMFKREVEFLSNLDHPNIVKIHAYYEDDDFMYYVMDRCYGGELFQRIIANKRIDEASAAIIFRQILSCVQYLHEHHIIHRDIKAENFLFKSDDPNDLNIVLIDFGLSCRYADNQRLHDTCGSPHYLAPEILKRTYSCAADMWALGVVLYLCLYGHYPYDGNCTLQIIRHILYKPVKYTHKERPSGFAINLISSLLQADDRVRITASQAMQHEWVTQHSEAITSCADGSSLSNRINENINNMMAQRPIRQA